MGSEDVTGRSDRVEAPKSGKSCCGGSEGRLDGFAATGVRGGDGIVSMSCLELGPRRRGFREGFVLLSGDGALPLDFKPLFGLLSTVPSLLKPPTLLF